MTNEHLPLCVKWRVNVHMCVCGMGYNDIVI